MSKRTTRSKPTFREFAKPITTPCTNRRCPGVVTHHAHPEPTGGYPAALPLLSATAKVKSVDTEADGDFPATNEEEPRVVPPTKAACRQEFVALVATPKALEAVRWGSALDQGDGLLENNSRELAELCLDGIQPTPKTPRTLFEFLWDAYACDDDDTLVLEPDQAASWQRVEMLDQVRAWITEAA